MSDAAVLETSTEDTTSTAPENSDLAALSYDLPAGGQAEAESQFADEPEPEAPAVEPAEDPAAETETVEVAEATGLDESLVSLAEVHGISKERAEAMGAENLSFVLAQLDKQAAEWGLSQLGAETGAQQQEQQKTEPAQQTTQQSQQTQQQVDAAIEKFKLEANADDWDAETLKAFTGLNDHYHGVISKQQQEMAQMRDLLLNTHDFVAQITGQHQQAEGAQTERDLDSFFDSLGDEFTPVYGKGGIRTLKADSTEAKNRNEVFRKMQALELADQHQGRTPMARTEMLKRVNAFLHPELIQTTARKELTQKTLERQRQMLPRPAGKNGKPQTNEESALAYLREHAPRMSS